MSTERDRHAETAYRYEPVLAEFHAALGESRRRRRRRGLRGVAGATAAIVAAVLVSSLDAARPADELGFVRPPGGDVRPAAGDETPSAQPGPASAAAPPVGPAARSTPVRSRAPEAAGATPPTPTASRVTRTKYVSGSAPRCDGADWCLTAGARRGEGSTLLLDATLCVRLGVVESALDYARRDEMSLELVSQQRSVRRLEVSGASAGEAHRISARAGECITWTTPWDRTDEAGRRLPPSRVRLVARSLAAQPTSPKAATADFELTF